MGKKITTGQLPRLFYLNYACKYGLDVAVFVTGLEQAIYTYADQKKWDKRTPPKVETLTINGLIYAPFTGDDLCREFPWWTVRQIRLIVRRSIEFGLLKKAYLDVNPMDHRLWYAVSLGDDENG